MLPDKDVSLLLHHVTGLSPDLVKMEQIRRIMRPTDVPDQGLLCDLLWSDPDKDTMGWGENDRGVSFTFGAEMVSKFLLKHDFDLICRAHQVSLDTAYVRSWYVDFLCVTLCMLRAYIHDWKYVSRKETLVRQFHIQCLVTFPVPYVQVDGSGKRHLQVKTGVMWWSLGSDQLKRADQVRTLPLMITQIYSVYVFRHGNSDLSPDPVATDS